MMSNNKNNKNCDYINVVPLTHCVKRSFLPTHVTISVDDCSFLKCNSQFLGELYQPIGKEDFYEEYTFHYLLCNLGKCYKTYEEAEKHVEEDIKSYKNMQNRIERS